MIEETLAVPDERGDDMRQRQDIALAAWILRSGALSERQLLEALRTWTIHGSVPLADHLVQKRLFDATAMKELSNAASAWVKDQVAKNLDPNRSSNQSVILSTLECIDPNGKIARLMGIRTSAGTGAVDASDARKATLGYRIIRKLGQGGLGRVWLAYDEHLNRHVAIKEVTVVNHTAAVERFRREAVITGKLEHPGIVPIYQLGTDEKTGHDFYVMRFLGKSTLHDAILEYHERRAEGDDDPMLIRKLLTDFVGVCQAIGHAHSRKVIHRDLKPENIAIDSFGQVIVIDWGIAKTIGDVDLGEEPTGGDFDSAAMQGTMQGQVLGTPLYMAPEQAAGRIDELNEQTDIYGLGAILFAILTGIAPHETTKDQAAANSSIDLLSAITSRPTPEASETDRAVDPALSAICAKAMARKQYARYQSATELADDVQRWMAGEPVSAHEEPKSQQLSRWVRRHQSLSTVLSVIVIAGIVTFAMLAATVRENRIAAHDLAFAELSDFENEIKLRLQSDAISQMQDARFMSTLPPIQAIIEARDGVVDADADEAVWQDRLGTIYTGLLRANPNYLSISYLSVESENATSIVRVERNARNVDSVRREPASRRSTIQDGEVLQALAAQSPGDVTLLIRPEMQSGAFARRGVRLLAITPVFHERTGDLFGLVMLESDLLKRIVHFLGEIPQKTADIYLVSEDGTIWVSEDLDDGIRVQTESKSVLSVIPELKDQWQSREQRRMSDRSEGWISGRVRLDSINPRAEIRVVMRLRELP